MEQNETVKPRRVKTPGYGRYGEATTTRRIPNSLLPFIDQILELKAAAVAGTPERVLKRMSEQQKIQNVLTKTEKTL